MVTGVKRRATQSRQPDLLLCSAPAWLFGRQRSRPARRPWRPAATGARSIPFEVLHRNAASSDRPSHRQRDLDQAGRGHRRHQHRDRDESAAASRHPKGWCPHQGLRSCRLSDHGHASPDPSLARRRCTAASNDSPQLIQLHDLRASGHNDRSRPDRLRRSRVVRLRDDRLHPWASCLGQPWRLSTVAGRDGLPGTRRPRRPVRRSLPSYWSH